MFRINECSIRSIVLNKWNNVHLNFVFDAELRTMQVLGTTGSLLQRDIKTDGVYANWTCWSGGGGYVNIISPR